MQQGEQSLGSYQWPNSRSRAYFGRYPTFRTIGAARPVG